MLIFLAFLLLAEIWICIHYSTSLSLPAYWAQGVEGSSKEEGGKIGGGRRGGCTVRAINVWSSFPLRDVRASSVGLGEGLPHVSRERVLHRTGILIFHVLLTWHPLSIAIQVQSSIAGLYFATCLQMKGHLGPAQFDNTICRKKFSFNSSSCLNSWHFYLLSSTLNYIEAKKNTTASIGLCCRIAQHLSASVALHLCCDTAWSRPATAGRHQSWKLVCRRWVQEPRGNFPGLLQSFSHSLDLL